MTDPEHGSYRFRPQAEGTSPENHEPALARARLAPTPRGRAICDERISVPDDTEGLFDPTAPRTQEAARYWADEALSMAINIALEVEAPLLLTGEPGTGKTQVAFHLAWYFGIPLYSFVVRSTSTAEDLRYDFDAVAYLRESQRLHDQAQPGQEVPEMPRDDPLFLTRNALWRAYRARCPSGVLIDEIDKGPETSRTTCCWSSSAISFRIPSEPRKPSRPVRCAHRWSSSPAMPSAGCPMPSCAAASITTSI